ncbi:translation initiation factor IF-2 [Butyricicoccus porcorum]|uniref:Translation initiation factor IF-2 n=1 Tax=Butyricicoccus porcorum TaxID=1945634 RepID=A0A252F0U2_9FIRM|nr:translation initiation factor IF-2 [Butyricicoccus porcorum]MCI6926857.1 translation initiation factor IF-2 [Butyricicoccus porcorum]MDY4484119.1 translation initiation factor IF-2 [Butyricicoccus porcorum]OUM19397.1 translation initiation factor IF-2 [Butyricicoccus porcorum]
MSIDNKYRVHEVAKDFGASTKEITDVLTEYSQTPKNHMQVLEPQELNLIFDYMTKHHPVDNMEEVLSKQAAERKAPTTQVVRQQPAKKAAKGEGKKAEAKKAEPQKKAAPQPAKEEAKQASAEPQKKRDNNKKRHQPAKPHEQRQILRPQGSNEEATSTVTTDENKQQGKGKQIHRVDTRGSGNVNLARYDERIDALVPQKADRMKQGKQKITRKADSRKQFSSKRRQEEQEKFKRLQRQQQQIKKVQLKVMIPDEINVGELASRLKRTAADVIKELLKLGVMANISQTIDFDTAAIVAEEMGAKVEKEVFVTIEEKLFDESEDKEENLEPRSPVVVVMGHVDHGKTSLLDSIRKTDVAAGEAGGITQHIGAYRVKVDGRPITFLDTPGHAAFTSMRARGAQVTDIAILVVAADDGIMPQTIEAINHAKAAGIPIIVAVNKIDKENADPDRVLQQLTEYELVPEDWGGDTIVCKISAKYGKGIDNLLEMVLLTADMQELRANPNRQAKGTVIEAKLDRGRGPVATVLVQNGTLHSGDTVIAGKAVGRVRVMTDERGRKLENAGPSVPVEIIGLGEVPDAGDVFYAVDNERMARELVEQRKEKEKEERNKAMQKVTLENLFDTIQQGNMKELNIIIKADVQGSVEAVRSSLLKLSNEEVRVNVIHGAVGAINESDVMLAAASNAIIVGFNVRPDRVATDSAHQQDVEIRLYRVIYDCIEEMEQAMKGMLDPKFKEVVVGHAEIRQTFKVSGVGTIAGAYVLDGKIVRSCEVRIVRDGIVIHEGHLNSLKRFKDDVKEVAHGFECGMGIENYNDLKEGDIIESFVMEQIKQ